MHKNEAQHGSHSQENKCDSFPDRMNVLCDKAGGGAALARMAGVSESVVRKWRQGESEPNLSKLLALADAAGVSVAWLAGREVSMLADDNQPNELAVRSIAGDSSVDTQREERVKQGMDSIEEAMPIVDEALSSAGVGIDRHWRQMIASWVSKYEFEEQHIKDLASLISSQAELANEFALIPGYNVEVAAGSGAFPSNEAPSRRLAFRHKWLRFKGLNEKNLVLVFARGDSMEPTISDNNTLMIDTGQRELSDGAIYVIRVNSHLVVKRVQTLLNRDIMLISDNTAYHPETLSPWQLNDLEVIGKVVWIGKDI
ncbi:S24 family peptidase [Amphritea sp. 2_MG-2023]|uniref:XRE family transcriptional regulator n=1 Tax=Amphritea TaxID=515417 RepID=UPI001C0783FC|nr:MULTISPECIES: S24 family peptidase [Amphritea]MBU2967091.1 helix-turn-helix domain-containing protein [Amphritea atlantica]MDO6419356.1 S24 family peptidase [Amphritea sp. 2_MG-2023]